jgi:formylglycine-generating enzyme required for sulfatase activity
MRILTLGLMITLAASAASLRAQVITLDMVPVGNAGNVADPATGSLYGAVPYNYNIGKYDVTVGQYAAFLNSVATKSDPYGLYNSGMLTDLPTIHITQNGSAPNYSYAVTGSAPSASNMPVFDVTWGDAARFCNWLSNGQPTSGTEATGTTEAGAYALNGATTDAQLMLVPSPSHSGAGAAAYFLPSENEWYKAAYYSGGGTNSAYYAYPTKSNTAPGNTLPDLGNNANFYLSNYTDPTNYLTPVGSFSASPGPYGTYDMGGDVFQWNEADISGSFRGLRGGYWYGYSSGLASSSRNGGSPTDESIGIGFRVASSVAVPEPGSLTLLLVCAVGFGIWRQRRNA